MRQISISQDGNARCAVFSEFVNLQESPAGFGSTDAEAIKELLQEAPMRCRSPMWWGWGGPAGHCGERAFGVSDVMRDGYYLCAEIAKCPQHGGPTLEQAVSDLSSALSHAEQLAAKKGAE
jgi:hypothetical protein